MRAGSQDGSISKSRPDQGVTVRLAESDLDFLRTLTQMQARQSRAEQSGAG